MRFYLGLFFCVFLALAASRGQDVAPLLQDGSLWQLHYKEVRDDLIKGKIAKDFADEEAGVYIISSSHELLPSNGVANSRFNTLATLPIGHVIWAWKGAACSAEEWRNLLSNTSLPAYEQARLLWVSATLKEIWRSEKKTLAELADLEKHYTTVLEEVLKAKGKRSVQVDTATSREVTVSWKSGPVCVARLRFTFQFAEGTKKAQREKVLVSGAVELVLAKDEEGIVAYTNQIDQAKALRSGERKVDVQKAVLNGSLWQMTPWELYKSILHDRVDSLIDWEGDDAHGRKTCAIDTNILSLREPGNEFPFLGKFLDSCGHYLWYWDEIEAPLDKKGEPIRHEVRALHWGRAWDKGSEYSDSERKLRFFDPHAQRRLKRISLMLYVDIGAKKSTPPNLQNLLKSIDAFASQKGEAQPDKQDALGRSIRSWRWVQEGKCAILLEAASAPGGSLDYVRLTFAPDVEHLMYQRTTREHIISSQELSQNVQTQARGDSSIEKGFKPYKAVIFLPYHSYTNNTVTTKYRDPQVYDYVDCDNAVLCYYGLCDIDNVIGLSNHSPFVEKQLKQRVKRVVLKSAEKALANYKMAFKMKQESFYQAKEAEFLQFNNEVMQYVKQGIPIICRDYLHSSSSSTLRTLSSVLARPASDDKAAAAKAPAYTSSKLQKRQKTAKALTEGKSPNVKTGHSSYWIGVIGSRGTSEINCKVKNDLGSVDPTVCSWLDSGAVYVLAPVRQAKE